jgi:hypothetical protein
MAEPPAEPDVITKTMDLALDGLFTDGAHHKQWYLEQILTMLGFDLDHLAEELEPLGYEWEPGIAP